METEAINEKIYYVEATARFTILFSNGNTYRAGEKMPSKFKESTLEKYRPYMNITKENLMNDTQPEIGKTKKVEEVK